MTEETKTLYLNPRRLLNEPPADGHQGLLWPLMKPVNSCAVNYGWELPSSNSQCRTDRRETHNDLYAWGKRKSESEALHGDQGKECIQLWRQPAAATRFTNEIAIYLVANELNQIRILHSSKWCFVHLHYALYLVLLQTLLTCESLLYLGDQYQLMNLTRIHQ